MNASSFLQALAAGVVLVPAATLAQASRPPTLLPDASQAARQRAMAQVMTVAPAAGDRRGDSQVLRASPTEGKGCAMSIAPLPDRHAGSTLLGTVNQTVVVQGSPILLCGR